MTQLSLTLFLWTEKRPYVKFQNEGGRKEVILKTDNVYVTYFRTVDDLKKLFFHQIQSVIFKITYAALYLKILLLLLNKT